MFSKVEVGGRLSSFVFSSFLEAVDSYSGTP